MSYDYNKTYKLIPDPAPAVVSPGDTVTLRQGVATTLIFVGSSVGGVINIDLPRTNVEYHVFISSIGGAPYRLRVGSLDVIWPHNYEYTPDVDGSFDMLTLVKSSTSNRSCIQEFKQGIRVPSFFPSVPPFARVALGVKGSSGAITDSPPRLNQPRRVSTVAYPLYNSSPIPYGDVLILTLHSSGANEVVVSHGLSSRRLLGDHTGAAPEVTGTEKAGLATSLVSAADILSLSTGEAIYAANGKIADVTYRPGFPGGVHTTLLRATFPYSGAGFRMCDGLGTASPGVYFLESGELKRYSYVSSTVTSLGSISYPANACVEIHNGIVYVSNSSGGWHTYNIAGSSFSTVDASPSVSPTVFCMRGGIIVFVDGANLAAFNVQTQALTTMLNLASAGIGSVADLAYDVVRRRVLIADPTEHVIWEVVF